jgi:hypothetical protein
LVVQDAIRVDRDLASDNFEGAKISYGGEELREAAIEEGREEELMREEEGEMLEGGRKSGGNGFEEDSQLEAFELLSVEEESRGGDPPISVDVELLEMREVEGHNAFGILR